MKSEIEKLSPLFVNLTNEASVVRPNEVNNNIRLDAFQSTIHVSDMITR